jgi:hypothetical protein
VGITNKPTLSVVVPVGKLFGDISALENWIPKCEKAQVILVLDWTDAKTLSSISNSNVLKNCKGIEVYEVEFGNPGETRNFGLTKTKGEWVTFSDADDLPNIEVIVRSIEDNKDETIDVLIGDYEIYRRDSEQITKVENKDLPGLLKSLPLGLGLWRFAFRKNFLESKKAEYPAISMAEDQIYFLRLDIQKSEVKYEKKVFYRYFLENPFQLTNDKVRIQDLQKSIPVTIETLEKNVSTERFDFLSAQMFSLLLNGSTRCLLKNVYFLIKSLKSIFNKFGLKKVALVFSYPIRRYL